MREASRGDRWPGPSRRGTCGGFTAEEARRQLDTAIEWGRYGELFEYDSESGQLILGSDPAKVGA
jgi:C-terminal AAA-associated domain